ncbi:MAG: glucosamine-6-phosphate deaminase [Deltaproteobacteria bacterium]|nr:glucosamine-6-phosphate deaminase [Deltaproteobacteria bacterium]
MTKSPIPTRRILELNILPTRDAMGKRAAGDVSRAMNRFIKERGNVNIAFAAAPSQDEFLFHLSRGKNIDWSRVTCFHLDDYVDLPRNHPNTFEVYLQGHLFNRVRPKQIHFFKALKGAPGEIARKYARLIEQSGGLHISCIGIGENGHIAFCDPGSDLHDPRMVRIIRLDDRSVRQQYRDYQDHPNPAARYASLKAVPHRAFTMTVPAILSAREIFTMVPGPQKAAAVKRMWEGPLSPACPSSALRMHPHVKIYLDEDSARKLSR